MLRCVRVCLENWHFWGERRDGKIFGKKNGHEDVDRVGQVLVDLFKHVYLTSS